MPLGFERINERIQRPNALINFIKPLPGTTSDTAEGILNRIAAICYPFMKKHMILVQALEEFPYNTEFVGRNFNAGEVIQLVLKNRQGQWLPEKWVMMVMVHELAHCKQMNHSKAFWKVRDAYAADLRELWSKGYTGEGLWGRGRSLSTGHIHAGSVVAGDVPEHLCGGTYGRRRKRRRAGKVKEELTYAEKKQRRILKKFGAGGQALGADDDTKVKLEGGIAKGKPRVAGSARGRELRAAAALARFESVKEEVSIVKEEAESGSETEDDFENTTAEAAAVDVDGKKMVDDRGHALVKICDHEDEKDADSRREMEEFRAIDVGPGSQSRPRTTTPTHPQPAAPSLAPRGPTAKRETKITSSSHVIRLDEIFKRRPKVDVPGPSSTATRQLTKPAETCTVCSLINDPGSLTCAACANVLNLELVQDKWMCQSMACKESQYMNSGDSGVCGVCGTSRPP